MPPPPLAPAAAAGAASVAAGGAGFSDFSGFSAAMTENAGYRFRLTMSWRISSEVVISFDAAWKARCVVIMFANSFVRSTFDISTEPEMTRPLPFWAADTLR